MMNADRKILIDTWYDVIDDEAHGVMCLFPTDGEGSIDDVIAKYGDDMAVILSSATWFLSQSGDGSTFPLEDANGRPFLGSKLGINPMRSGDRWEDPNGDDLIATADGWVPAEQADVHTYGATLG